MDFHFVYFDPKLSCGKKARLGMIQFLHLNKGENLANRERIWLAKGRVALEPVLFTSNFWRVKIWQNIWQVPNFGDGHIGPTCFNHNVADRLAR